MLKKILMRKFDLILFFFCLCTQYDLIKKKKLFIFSLSWYPPGHGDFYDTFCSSGLLKQFIGEGREYCFLSNIDNLGATVDLNILNKLLGEDRPDKPAEFVMEVTDKTRADVKVI